MQTIDNLNLLYIGLSYLISDDLAVQRQIKTAD
jgi:hypothetical protein